MEFSKAWVRRSKQYTRCQAERAILKEQGSREFQCVHKKNGSVPPVGRRMLAGAVSTLKLEHRGEGGRWGGVVVRENYESKGEPWWQLWKTWKGLERVTGRGQHFPSVPWRLRSCRRTTPVTAWDAEQRARSQQVGGTCSVIEKLRRRRDVCSSGYCSDWARKSFLAKDQYPCNTAQCACLPVSGVF